jgi:hypothetical protein
MARVDLTGNRFGRLLVLGEGGRKHRAHLWRCQCDCGNIKEVRGCNLTKGLTQSCGCLCIERVKQAAIRRWDKKEDLTGRVYGFLTVLKRDDSTSRGESWVCRCKCGEITKPSRASLVSGKSKSCGCRRKVLQRYDDLAGMRFGKLLVIEFVEYNKHKNAKWRCVCDCGKEKITTATLLNQGQTRSCGCLNKNSLAAMRKATIKYKGDAIQRRLYSHYKVNAKKRNLAFDLVEDEFYALISEKCFYCGAEAANHCRTAYIKDVLIYNGLDRVDPVKGYALDNVVPCCKTCNWAKQKMGLEEFYAWLARAYSMAVSKGAYDKGVVHMLEHKATGNFVLAVCS